MTYNPNIPQGSDNLSASQVQLLANMGQLNSQFGIDHVAFNTGSGNGTGFHSKVTLLEQVSDPATGADQVALYNKGNNIYCRQENNATPFILIGSFLAAQNGYVNLAGGIRIQWGRATIPGGGTTVPVVFPLAFSGAAYMVVVTPFNNPITGTTPKVPGVDGPTITAAGFTLVNWNGPVPGSGVPCGWIAVGPS